MSQEVCFPQHMTKTIPHRNIPRDLLLDEIERSPVGEKIRADIAKRRLEERRKLAKALADAEQSLLDELPSLDASIENSVEAVRVAELALADAVSTLGVARSAKKGATFEFDRLSRLYCQQLRENASPAVGEFYGWLRDELDRLPKAIVVHRKITSSVSGPIETVESNREALNARQNAILQVLRDEIPRLELEPDDAVVEARINEIKSTLPALATTEEDKGK